MSTRKTVLLLFLVASPVRADKVIMKDGKIYQGKIMGETSRSVLISNPPLDPKPHFLEMRDILTIVRESHPPEEAPPERGRYATVEAHLTGQVFSSDTLTLHPAPGIHVAGGFRMHPLLELDAELDWLPALSGDLSVTDGTTTREYERFFAYSGGFSARAFPFYTHRDWKLEPYVLVGYQWNRLVAKDAGDYLKGSTLETGVGVLWPWKYHFYWDARLLYRRTSYDQIQFLLREGSLNSSIHVPSVGLFMGLAYRFL